MNELEKLQGTVDEVQVEILKRRLSNLPVRVRRCPVTNDILVRHRQTEALLMELSGTYMDDIVRERPPQAALLAAIGAGEHISSFGRWEIDYQLLGHILADVARTLGLDPNVLQPA